MEDLAIQEEMHRRTQQRKTSPRWDQQYGSIEALKEAIDRTLSEHPPYPRTLTHYVDEVLGNDTTGDGGENKPWKTIGKAETEAGEKDTILAWGSFPENVIIDTVGLRLLGLGNGLTTIQGGGNDLPKITLDADSIEVTLLYLVNGGFTGHGIWIDDSNHFNIHHNLMHNISGGYDGISKTALPINEFGRIEHNIIRSGVRGGISLERARRTTIYKNSCILNIAQGIRLVANSLFNDVIGNICNYNDEGIDIEGDDNNMVDNTALGNITANLIDTGARNLWNNRFSSTPTGTHTTAGGAEETVFGETCVQPMTRIHGYLRLNNMVALDDFTFRVKKSYDSGVTWDFIDETNLVGDQLIDRYDFDILLENSTEQLWVTVQRNGAVDRAFYHKRTKGDD